MSSCTRWIKGDKWETKARVDGRVIDTYEARTLWKMIAEAAWACADPGVQYDTTINDWHTCRTRTDSCVQSVLGVHVPERHGLQPLVA